MKGSAISGTLVIRDGSLGQRSHGRLHYLGRNLQLRDGRDGALRRPRPDIDVGAQWSASLWVLVPPGAGGDIAARCPSQDCLTGNLAGLTFPRELDRGTG